MVRREVTSFDSSRLSSVVAYVESDGFAANLALNDSGRALLRYFESSRTLRGLRDLLVDRETAATVFDRVQRLWALLPSADEPFKWDLSVAAYLYCLVKANAILSKEAMRLVFDQRRRDAWATYVIYNALRASFASMADTAFSTTRFQADAPVVAAPPSPFEAIPVPKLRDFVSDSRHKTSINGEG